MERAENQVDRGGLSPKRHSFADLRGYPVAGFHHLPGDLGIAGLRGISQWVAAQRNKSKYSSEKKYSTDTTALKC